MKKKITSIFIVTVLLFNATACNRKTEVIETNIANIEVDASGVITDDSDWYVCNHYFLEDEYSIANGYVVQNDILNVSDSDITTLITGYYEDSSVESSSDHDRMNGICYLNKYGFDGTKLSSVDLSMYNDIFEDDGEQIQYSVYDSLLVDEHAYILCRYQNYTTNDSAYKIIDVNVSTCAIESQNSLSDFNDALGVWNSVHYTAVGDDSFLCITGRVDNYGYFINPKAIQISKDGVVISENDLNDLFSSNSIDYINNLYSVDDQHYILSVCNEMNEISYWVIDTVSNEVSTFDLNVAVQNSSLESNEFEFSECSGIDSNFFAIKSGSIVSALNTETMAFEQVYDVSHCNINRYTFERTGNGVLSYSNETLVMAEGEYSIDCPLMITVINQCEGNPYQGRTLLTAASIGQYCTYEEAELVYRFNRDQEDVYIIIDDSYVSSELTEQFSSDYMSYISGISEITSQLAIDLISGEGPDIIFDGYNYAELNNTDCLIDIMPYIEDGGFMDSSTYYSNVFSLASNNNQLFQVPLNINIVGLYSAFTASSEMPNAGFTFDEYELYIDDVYNGYDPLNVRRNQVDYFTLCFNAMDDLFINDGVIDLDNDAFYALVDYCSRNAFDLKSSEDVGSGEMFYYDRTLFTNDYGLLNYIYGIPSYDGRGVQLSCTNSVGVSASCSNPDMAIEFIYYSLSTSTQTDLFGLNSVIRDVAQNASYDYVDELNRINGDMQYTYEYADMQMDIFAEVIQNASGFYSSDSDVTSIIYEEMPAYFCGDKTIEEIIPIIEDRIQTVLGERG